jgi:hypothetical protein
MSIRPDDPRLADFTPEEIARGVPQQIAEQERPGAPMQYDIVSDTTSVENGRNVRRIQYSNGVVQTQDLGPADGDTGSSGTAAVAVGPRTDARTTIAAVLNRFGLGSLSNFLYEIYTRGEVDLNNPDALIFAIRDRPEYQTRFAANARRAAKNLPELDPGSYLELENAYRSVLQSNGLPPQFYDTTEDFSDLITGDVSPAELQSRIQNGYRKVSEADPEVKRQMRQLYNVDDAGLAAYFLDPQRATPVLEAQARAAQIAARGREQGNVQLSRLTAEELVSRGFTEQQAQEAFQRMNLLGGLYTEMGGEEALTEAEKIGATFGYDVEAQQRLAQRRAQRVAEFAGGGAFARTTGATSGTVETGVGTAQ